MTKSTGQQERDAEEEKGLEAENRRLREQFAAAVTTDNAKVTEALVVENDELKAHLERLRDEVRRQRITLELIRSMPLPLEVKK